MKKQLAKQLFAILILFGLLGTNACAPEAKPAQFSFDADTLGQMEVVNNIVNTSIVSNDPNTYKAEFEAGFLQGKLQKSQIIAARDNLWDIAYLQNAAHTYPKQIPPSADELNYAQSILNTNYQYTLDYIRKEGNSDTGNKLRRLLYRLVGIYYGATRDKPEGISYDDAWLPSFSENELKPGYESASLSFMDVYFINAYEDFLDAADGSPQSTNHPNKCSAFVKRTSNDIIITHNTWSGFLSQTQALSLWVNGDFISINIFSPGQIGSLTDFGYNNKNILFNETTHHATYSEPKNESLWMFWRSALAEQFATSLDDFFKYISLEPSGTYMNGYMVVDAKTKEIGLVEMSYKNFVFFKSNDNNGYDVTTKPDGISKEYDKEMLTPDAIMGINYPASQQIRDDLKAMDTRPARRRQFLEKLASVKDVESAKALITYTDPKNPLSIFGRWDLGYGETSTPKTIPDGAIDAKVMSASMVQDGITLKGTLDLLSPDNAFWMKFGTPIVDGKPFIWSQSQWKSWKLRDVPDRLDGEFTLVKTHIR